MNFSVVDGVLFQVVADQGVDDDGLACVLDLLLDGCIFTETFVFRFLHQHFTADQVLLDHFAQLRRIRLLALGDDLLDDCINARRWDRLAINNGNILRKNRYRDNGE